MTANGLEAKFLRPLRGLHVEDEPEARAELAAFLGRRVGRVELADQGGVDQ